MIIHIGMPRAASTAIEKFMAGQMSVAHADLRDLLHKDFTTDYVRAESVIDGVHVGDPIFWQRYLYEPGGWPGLRGTAAVDISHSAKQLYTKFPNAKILVILRDYKDFIDSVYRYAVHQLPWGKRSRANYLATPSGITHQMIGDGQYAVAAFRHYFGDNLLVLRYEDLINERAAFMDALCIFCNAKPGRLPRVNKARGGLMLLAKRIMP